MSQIQEEKTNNDTGGLDLHEFWARNKVLRAKFVPVNHFNRSTSFADLLQVRSWALKYDEDKYFFPF